ncbi:hypothetical protein PROFUN_12937 [Planoprotostelium fungivorum]|uniref:Uncharacterized protein n=1 Tax=Planoprotostelium fungivorum TaxID=1890364 RepID=A0A2P6N5V5_9EUKA|nr:hypothetical protein PROFUN_12937 [Planoprotostelium fungivorum]
MRLATSPLALRERAALSNLNRCDEIKVLHFIPEEASSGGHIIGEANLSNWKEVTWMGWTTYQRGVDPPTNNRWRSFSLAVGTRRVGERRLIQKGAELRRQRLRHFPVRNEVAKARDSGPITD